MLNENTIYNLHMHGTTEGSVPVMLDRVAHPFGVFLDLFTNIVFVS